MQLVLLNRKKEFVDDNLVKKIAGELPRIVSMALNIPHITDGKLVPDDIEVWVDDSSELDVNTKPLEIIIWATEFSERRANLNFRRQIIVDEVKKLIPSTVKGFVWVLLHPASFGEF